MSETLRHVQALVAERDILISDHGYDELANDDIFVQDVIRGIGNATVIEDYPTFYRGSAVLVLQIDSNAEPIHVVWGIPKGASSPAVLVTAYRPDPKRWSEDFMRRRP